MIGGVPACKVECSAQPLRSFAAPVHAPYFCSGAGGLVEHQHRDITRSRDDDLDVLPTRRARVNDNQRTGHDPQGVARRLVVDIASAMANTGGCFTTFNVKY